jgi:hypothetical protein
MTPKYGDVKRIADKTLQAVRETCRIRGRGEEDFYCVPLAEYLAAALDDAGFRTYKPLYGHIWVGVGDWVVDLWEAQTPHRVKIFHHLDLLSNDDYIWPGKHRGVRPVDVPRYYPYAVEEELYYNIPRGGLTREQHRNFDLRHLPKPQ